MSVSWVFQSNPNLFDIDNALIEAKENNLAFAWRVTQHKNEVMPGHIVYIWRSQGSGKFKSISGIIAKGRITSFPKEYDYPDWEVKYDRRNELGTRLRVDIKIDSIANKKQVIKKSWLEKDPIFSTHRIITSRQGTNFKLSLDQTKRLVELYEKTGRDWTREESLAVLWLYYQLLDKKISKSANSPVAQTALTIGRSVTGVYNKLMNFRYIDPTDPRKGLSGVNEVDERVWNEFFDKQKIEFKAHQLEKQYLSLWVGDAVNLLDDEPEEGEDWESEEKLVLKQHKRYERRNSKAIKDLKEKLDYPPCKVCGMSFEKEYGIKFIEAHHIIPFSEMKKKGQTSRKIKEKDIAMLCANCHRMIHKYKDMSLDELKKLYESMRSK